MQSKMFRFWPHVFLLSFLWLVMALPSYAVEPFQVKEIRVEGLQRVEAGTVYATLPFRAGETYTDEKGALSIRNLFALGVFKDVRIQTVGRDVVVVVQERPTISLVEFTGNKEFDKDYLVRMMREIGLFEGRPFDKAVADKAEQEIRRQYLSRSYFATKITLTATPIDSNRVNLNLAITEGDVAKIAEIKFVGNKAFSSGTLTDEMSMATGNWWSWYTKNNHYSKAKLNADIEAIRSFYLSRGYIEFSIEAPKVDISPAQDEIRITISLFEGAQFQVAGVRFEGNLLGKEQELKSNVTVDIGKPFDAEKANESSQKLSKALGNLGYAFARAEVIPVLDRVGSKVTLVFKVEPGVRAYVRRVNISGNARTRDEVIRREFRQIEASWYDGDKIRASRDRIDRLGFFTDVQIDTQEVPGAPDQVDVNLVVVEKSTANWSLGAGYSTAEKLSLQAGIRQENAFGSGHYIGLNVDTSKFNRQLAINNTDPYFTPEGVSRSTEVFYRTTKPTTLLDTDYKLINQGVGLSFGVPYTENDTVYFRITYDQLRVQDGTNLPQTYKNYVQRVGSSSHTVPVSIGWGSDTRDSALAPSVGSVKRINVDLNVIGESKYAKGTVQYQHYIPLSRKVTVAFNSQLDWGEGLGGNPYPFFKNFYGGGLGSVRGFETNSLGPVDETTKLSIGGAKAAVVSLEVLTPLPGGGNDRTLRMYGFIDVGNVFGESQPFKFGGFKSSMGIGLSWNSPVGPLRLSFAKPIKKSSTDKLEKIQFQIGTGF
jgi:outer membrane protein insertion porin family